MAIEIVVEINTWHYHQTCGPPVDKPTTKLVERSIYRLGATVIKTNIQLNTE